jgi:hypothetical protein
MIFGFCTQLPAGFFQLRWIPVLERQFTMNVAGYTLCANDVRRYLQPIVNLFRLTYSENRDMITAVTFCHNAHFRLIDADLDCES